MTHGGSTHGGTADSTLDEDNRDKQDDDDNHDDGVDHEDRADGDTAGRLEHAHPAEEPEAGVPSPSVQHAQAAAFGIGVVLILLGFLGFIPAVTSHYNGTGGMGFSGINSDALLFHVFRVSVLHNGIDMVLGLFGLVGAFTPLSAKLYLLAGGMVNVVLFVWGFAVNQGTNANWLPYNSAGIWLHVGLAVVMIALGLVLGRYSGFDRPQDRRRQTA
jgi:hypothetical protein